MKRRCIVTILVSIFVFVCGCTSDSDVLLITIDDSLSYETEQIDLDYDFKLANDQDISFVGAFSDTLYFLTSTWDLQPIADRLYGYDMTDQSMREIYTFSDRSTYSLMEVQELNGVLYCSGFYHNDQNKYGIYMIENGALTLLLEGEIKDLGATPELVCYKNVLLYIDEYYETVTEENIKYVYRINSIDAGNVEVMYAVEQTEGENTEHINVTSLMANDDYFAFVTKTYNGYTSKVIVFKDGKLYKEYDFDCSVGDIAIMGDHLLVQYGYVEDTQTKIELALIDMQNDARRDTSGFDNRIYDLKMIDNNTVYADVMKDLSHGGNDGELYIPYLLRIEDKTIYATKMDDIILSEGAMYAKRLSNDQLIIFGYRMDGKSNFFNINYITLRK